jgi:NodT family efflux transporter outer membrane factor (OMF) lipoprotein
MPQMMPSLPFDIRSARTRAALAALVLAVLGACKSGPDYVRPPVGTPAGYKEIDGWKTAQPRDDEIRGKWWEMFGDPLLSSLLERIEVTNQTLIQAEASFRQSRALVQVARASYFPLVTGNVSVTRTAPSTNQGSRVIPASGPTNNHSASLDATWEADLWGRISRTVEQNLANAQASAADLQTARLSVQGELAMDYFQLRALDTQKQLLDATAQALARTLQLAQNRYAAGVVSKSDVTQAQTQLRTTQAQALDLGVQRSQLEHAIALLLGQTPSDFSLPAAALTASPPDIPVGIPSQVLERRPDIAAAERRVAAANAQIGVTEAAFFPALTLSASAGLDSSTLARWLSLPSYNWSVGPALALALFDGGLRRAQTQQARAAYDVTVALYRQTVLTGFREVEDNLAALRILTEEASVQSEAVQAAQESLTMIMNQYKAGLVSFTDVVTVQTNALNNQRTAVDILNRRMAASVALVKALGGGWSAADLPMPDALMRTSTPPAPTAQNR